MGAAGVKDDPDVILASGSYDHNIRLWAPHTGVCTRIYQHPDSQVNSMAISPDRRTLAAAGFQHIRMYDLISETMTNSIANYDGVNKNVTAVGYQADNLWMYSGGEDGCVRIWDLKCRNTQWQNMENIGNPVNCVSLHPNQVDLYIGDQSGVITVWNLRTKTMEKLMVDTDVSIQHLDIEPEGNHLAVVGNNGKCYIFQIRIDGPRLQPRLKLNAHSKYALKCYFSPDSTLLMTTSADQTAKVWRTADLLPLRESDLLDGSNRQNDNSDKCLTRKYCTASWPKCDGLQPTPLIELKDEKNNQRWVWDAAWSADSQYAVTASSDNMVRLWNVNNGRVKRIFGGHSKAVTALALADSLS